MRLSAATRALSACSAWDRSFSRALIFRSSLDNSFLRSSAALPVPAGRWVPAGRFVEGTVQVREEAKRGVGRSPGWLIRQDGQAAVLPRNHGREDPACQHLLLQFRQGIGQACPVCRRQVRRFQRNVRPGQKLVRRHHADAGGYFLSGHGADCLPLRRERRKQWRRPRCAVHPGRPGAGAADTQRLAELPGAN
jgi:hypothetical protein